MKLTILLAIIGTVTSGLCLGQENRIEWSGYTIRYDSVDEAANGKVLLGISVSPTDDGSRHTQAVAKEATFTEDGDALVLSGWPVCGTDGKITFSAYNETQSVTFLSNGTFRIDGSGSIRVTQSDDDGKVKIEKSPLTSLFIRTFQDQSKR